MKFAPMSVVSHGLYRVLGDFLFHSTGNRNLLFPPFFSPTTDKNWSKSFRWREVTIHLLLINRIFPLFYPVIKKDDNLYRIKKGSPRRDGAGHQLSRFAPT